MFTRREVTGQRRAAAILVILTALAGAACSRTVGPGVADAELAARVKTAIVNDPDLGVEAIDVRASGGVIVLSGTVSSEPLAARAVEVARAVQGVGDVRSSLTTAVPVDRGTTRRPQVRPGGAAYPSWPSLFAVGASGGVHLPDGDTLDTGYGLGPSIILGERSGLGPWIGFSWYRISLRDEDEATTFGTLRVRPIMGGVAYTVRRGRWSGGVNLLGGFAFNSFEIEPDVIATRRPVAASRSFVWRPGGGVAYRLGPRLTATWSVGYLMTRPELTYVDGDRTVETRIDGDAFQIGAGLVYWLF